MKIYIIKHKGANTWANVFCGYSGQMEFNNGDIISYGYYFFRRKDAVRVLKTMKYSEFYEVVSATLKPTTQDNRRKIYEHS